jgi:isocitrate dehydrogenase
VKRFSVAVLPGDGIGPEVTRQAVRVLELAGELFGYRIDLAKYAIGAEALVEDGDPLPSAITGTPAQPVEVRRQACSGSAACWVFTLTCGRWRCIRP